MAIILIILYGISINDILLWESLSHQLVFLVLLPSFNFLNKNYGFDKLRNWFQIYKYCYENRTTVYQQFVCVENEA